MKGKSGMMQRVCKRREEGGRGWGRRQRTGSGDGQDESKWEEGNDCNNDERSGETEREKQENQTGSGSGPRSVKGEVRRLETGDERYLSGPYNAHGPGREGGGASANDTVN